MSQNSAVLRVMSMEGRSMVNMKCFLALVLIAPLMRADVQPPMVLNDGTPVRLRLSRNLSSADANTGDKVDFEVVEDVRVGEITVIARGARALATVTNAEAKRRMGRGGKLDVNVDSIRLTDQEKVPLRAVKEESGGGHVGAMAGAMVATSLVVWPAAPFFLLMHGKDVTIKEGTEITAYIAGDITLDSSKFLPKAAAATAAGQIAAVPASGRAMSNADVLALKGAGISDDILIAKVRASAPDYHLDTTDLIQLKSARVADGVIQAMI